MSEEIQRPYWVPKSVKEWNDVIRGDGLPKPWWHVSIPNNFLSTYDEFSCFTLPFLFWFRDNLKGTTVWMSDKSVFAFESGDVANSFKEWRDTVWYPSHHGNPMFSSNRKDPFPSRNDFLSTLADSGTIHIGGKVHKKLEYHVLSLETIEVFFWMLDHCDNRVWRWDDTFFFESADEAVQFKLVYG